MSVVVKKFPHYLTHALQEVQSKLEMNFTDKVVLITGAGSGVGAAAAKAFAKHSAKLSLIDINEQDLDTTIAVCNANSGDVLKLVVDVSNDGDMKLAVDATVKRFGQVDVVVNCAAIFMQTSILDEDMMERYDRIIAVNLRSVVAMVNYVAPFLIKTKGSIVNISSIAVDLTTVSSAAYSISKAGIVKFTKCAALELADKGVRVNSISPGAMKTKFYQYSGMSDDEVEAAVELCRNSAPLKKLIDPEEIAELVLFLSSDKAKSITGSDYLFDAGIVLSGIHP